MKGENRARLVAVNAADGITVFCLRGEFADHVVSHTSEHPNPDCRVTTVLRAPISGVFAHFDITVSTANYFTATGTECGKAVFIGTATALPPGTGLKLRS